MTCPLKAPPASHLVSNRCIESASASTTNPQTPTQLRSPPLCLQQGDLERAYDLLSAPPTAQYDRPDRFTRALLAGQLMHAQWVQARLCSAVRLRLKMA